jgi:hypothetical protein
MLALADRDDAPLRAMRGDDFDAEFPPREGEDAQARIAQWRGNEISYARERLPAGLQLRLDEIFRNANARRRADR